MRHSQHHATRGLAALVGLALLALGVVPAEAARRTATSTSLTAPTTIVNTAVTMTAVVSPAPAGGTVSFTALLGKTRIALSCGAVPVAGGTAACTFVPTAGGNYSLTATYSGTKDIASSAGTTTLSVTPPPTITTTTASITTTARAYSPVSLAAAVAPVPNGGSVTFTASIGGSAVALPAGCASIAVNAGGGAGCAFTPQTAGALEVTARFSGTSAFAASSGATTGTVSPAATTVTVTDNATTVPGGPAPAVFGQTVIFTARVAAAGSPGTPSGAVAWTLGYTGPVDAAAALGTCTSSALVDGVATCYVTPTTYYDFSNDPTQQLPFTFPIIATAEFLPNLGTGWAGSSGSDSTSKITIGSILPSVPPNQEFLFADPVSLQVVQSDALGRTLTTWWDSALTGLVGRDTPGILLILPCPDPAFPDAFVLRAVDTFYAMAVCPKGVDRTVSFECQQPAVPFINLKNQSVCGR